MAKRIKEEEKTKNVLKECKSRKEDTKQMHLLRGSKRCREKAVKRLLTK